MGLKVSVQWAAVELTNGAPVDSGNKGSAHIKVA